MLYFHPRGTQELIAQARENSLYHILKQDTLLLQLAHAIWHMVG